MNYLSICKCPEHGVYSINIDNYIMSTRIIGGKCCGRWIEVMRWYVTETELREISNELLFNADEIEKQSKNEIDVRKEIYLENK